MTEMEDLIAKAYLEHARRELEYHAWFINLLAKESLRLQLQHDEEE